MSNAERPKAEIEEDGKSLAVVPRREHAELHVNWCELDGNQYVSIKEWTAAPGGALLPNNKRYVTIRVNELLATASALNDAIALASAASKARGKKRMARSAESNVAQALPLEEYVPKPGTAKITLGCLECDSLQKSRNALGQPCVEVDGSVVDGRCAWHEERNRKEKAAKIKKDAEKAAGTGRST